MKQRYKYLLKIAIDAARLAGKFLRDNKSIKIISEDNKDIKLNVDFKSESIIFKKLLEHYPILSEESGGVLLDKSPIWIVDPLDGTVNYSRKIPLSCISIALWIKKKPVLGVIYDFTRNELFSGIVGFGAKLDKKKIKVSKIKKKSKSIIFTGFPVKFSLTKNNLKKFIGLVQDYKKIRLIGSAALSLAYVASGRAEVYHEKCIKIWDVAAGLALVKAAGGFYEFSNTNNNFNVYASNIPLKKYINYL
jgi:myo-inositol-1(or 4)-monophosphatase